MGRQPNILKILKVTVYIYRATTVFLAFTVKIFGSAPGKPTVLGDRDMKRLQ